MYFIGHNLKEKEKERDEIVMGRLWTPEMVGKMLQWQKSRLLHGFLFSLFSTSTSLNIKS
ncbi:hypothetical protein HanIR_Chr10g0495041 [Helianthus annuus]|nr:hypothetical protein HanIR_Chr10g0495041 [Helianthus annuus]